MDMVHYSPKRIRVDREQGIMRVVWQNDGDSAWSLAWLRANCPCATCRAQRGQAGTAADPLSLHTGPMPSAEVADLELVGGYALRITWQDGHNTGIYAFSWLHAQQQDIHDPETPDL